MATEKDVKKSIEIIEKETEKVGGWVEERIKQIRAGKTAYIELKLSFKVT